MNIKDVSPSTQKHWKEFRKLKEINADLLAALKALRRLNADAAMSGYTDRNALAELFAGNQNASAAIAKAEC